MPDYDAPERAWIGEQDQAYGRPAMVPPVPVQRYELRPLSTGEILDRTFVLYRSRFWLYTALSSIGAVLTTLGAIGSMTYMQMSGQSVALTARGTLVSSAVTLVGALLAFVAYSFTQAATTSAVAAVYLGRETSIGMAVRSVQRTWYRYILIALWQAWSYLWVPVVLFLPAFGLTAYLAVRTRSGAAAIGILVVLLFVGGFGGFIYGIVAYLRNSLAVPASVMEGLPVRPSMRRSKLLTPGTKGRIFLMGLLLGALYMVAGTLQFVFGLMIAMTRSYAHVVGQVGSLLVGFLTGALVGPVAAIALCLFYIDQRVRKEGFDLEFLISLAAPPQPMIPRQPVSAEIA
jgi:hypothetical protein